MGAPVITVEQPTLESTRKPALPALTEASTLPSPVVSITLEKIVPLDSMIVFYISMQMEDRDPALISIMPVDVYVIDSQGQKSRLHGNYTWQPFEHRPGSLFEFRSQSRPAAGPLTVIMENAVAYYAPLYVDPPQATPEEMSFTFDSGENPQPGQIWQLDEELTISGYPLKITSVRAVTWQEVRTAEYIDGSQGYEFGYQFAVQSDPTVKVSLWMDIMSESPVCWLMTGAPHIPSGSSQLYTQLCRERYPSGPVRVTIGGLSVLLEDTWQATWTP